MSDQKKDALPLGIMELKVKNILGIEAAFVQPTGELTLITGKNAQGKSSLLNSIFLGLQGKAPGVEEPIRHGTQRAEIVIGLGTEEEMKAIVTRRFSAGKSPSLSLKPADGSPPLKSPQKLLNSIFDSTTIDPSEYKNLHLKEQAKRLMKSLGIDVEALNDERQVIFDARKEANSAVRRQEALAGELPAPPPKDTPDEQVSVKELLARQAELRALRDDHEDWLATVKLGQDHCEALRQSVADQEQTIATLEARLEAERSRLSELQSNATAAEACELKSGPPPMPDPNGEKEIQDALANVETVNENVRAKHERRKVLGELKKARQEASRLDNDLKAFDERSVHAVSAAMEKFPVKGLSVNEDGVFVNDVPLDQCSTAEQWITWTRIGMAQKPKLRVILIRDGSDMDSDTLRALSQLARDERYWLWVEKVLDEPGKEGIHFEAGEVVAVNGNEVIKKDTDSEVPVT